MAETFRSDGKAVDVTVDTTITKGDPVRAEGFSGIAMQDAVSGETIAIEIALREHELTVDGGVTADKGDTLYITDAGAISDSASGNTAFCKVTKAKDGNNVIWAVLLPQS